MDRHGRIFTTNLLGKGTIVSADPELNRFILQNEGRLFENSCPTSIKDIMGPWSMLALAGDVHKEMRSIAVNFMSNVKLRTFFLPDIEKQALEVLHSWKDRSTFSAQEEGKKVTSIINQTEIALKVVHSICFYYNMISIYIYI